MGVTRFHRPCINVSDMERSLAFYRDLLGLKVIYDRRMGDPARAEQQKFEGVGFGVSEPDFRYVHMEFAGEGGRGILLVQWFNPQPRPRARVPRFSDNEVTWTAFDVEGLKQLYEQLKNQGVKFLGSLAEREGRGMCFALDPDGKVVELHGTL